MKKIKIMFLYLLFSLCLYVFCQNKIKEDIFPIAELRVVNFNLYSAMDTIIQLKEKINFYKGTQSFIISFNQDSIPDLVFIRAYEKFYYYDPDILGCFDYKDHCFVVRGNAIDSTIFQKTNTIQKIDFSFPPQEYTTDGKPIVRTFENFAVWSMRYKSGKFRILSFFTDNEDDEWFDCIEEEYNELEIFQ